MSGSIVLQAERYKEPLFKLRLGTLTINGF